jgi:hypothetical protein
MKSANRSGKKTSVRKARRKPTPWYVPQLAFYRQECVDGGLYTGVSLKGDDILEHHQDGSGDDPRILWLVDVRCSGESLPDDPVQARDWFMDHAAFLKAALVDLKDRLEVGFHAHAGPYQWEVPNAPPGVQVLIVCHACHRIVGREMGVIVATIAANWEKLLRSLKLAVV